MSDRPTRTEPAADGSAPSASTWVAPPRVPELADVRLPARFEPVRVLGRGGMGVVVQARDRSLGRDVAVKLLSSDGLVPAQARARFLREARAAGSLRHPHMVTVFDVSIEDDYLVMELIDGETLARRLRAGPLPPEDVRRVGRAVLSALEAAHQAGMIHRDVKPANILIGADGVVKLADFGIASFTDSELTSTGDVIGTPAYMAPEQLRGRHVSARADIYSAGATLFQAATGKRLNDKDGTCRDPRAAVLAATQDEALARAIACAVEEREDDRFPSAAAFAAALADRTRSRRRRARRLVTAAPVVVAFAAVVAFGVFLFEPNGVPSAARAEHARRVAVLPFSDRTADARLDFASSGLPHLLGGQLGSVEGLSVIGYYRIHDVLTDPRAPEPAWRAAALALGADVLVRGEVAAADGGARARDRRRRGRAHARVVRARRERR